MANEEYKVEGYNVRRPEYDGEYLPQADFNPAEVFAEGGKDHRTEEEKEEQRAAIKAALAPNPNKEPKTDEPEPNKKDISWKAQA